MADLATPLTIRTVATLGVADVVRDGPVAAADIAGRCGAEADALARVLRFLVQRGIFTEPERDVFGPNEGSDALRRDAPGGLQPWLDLDGAVGRADLAFVELVEQVRGHHRAYPAAFGRSFWEDLGSSPQLSDSFDSLMETKAQGIAPAVAIAHPWSAYVRIADVGGGKGVLLAEILKANPGTSGVLLDLRGPAQHATEYFAEQGVAERTDVVVANFFEPLTITADAVVLCDVLGDWDDADAVQILRNCAPAAGAHGRVLIVEFLADSELMQTFTELDLRMMVYVGGRMRGLDGMQHLAERAWLTVEDVTPLDNGYAIIECRRTPADDPPR
ncbi:SAM-dependent methyltransferase [Saccharopolyspora sp. HNM0983]|uniref:SAM-dependent methyltransferase n=2 Tax=Saccharopolyspora montiporae TaxID=2781240 RepID=A0A929FZG2_9PSEU|nr:SAM-dependent methyltransferase [Saccharopolyspora sp. HNM0983]